MSGRSRSWRYVTAEPGDPIAIRFHVTEEYDWKDANGLLLELFLDSGEAQVALPIPRDPECSTITLNIPDWPCWFEDVSEDGVTSGSWKQTSFEFQEPNKPAVSLRKQNCILISDQLTIPSPRLTQNKAKMGLA